MWRKRINYLEFSDGIKKVIISLNIIKTFQKFGQKLNKLEAGGILLGNVFENYDLILKISIPNPLDSRGFNFFNRSKIPAQKKINDSWKRSKGDLIYLGEWHTHSELNPQPSPTDVKMINKVFKETVMEINFLYLIIVGVDKTFWVGRQNSNGLVKLEEIK